VLQAKDVGVVDPHEDLDTVTNTCKLQRLGISNLFYCIKYNMRTELQERAYATIPKSERHKRLWYSWSMVNWLVKEMVENWPNGKTISWDIENWFFRELDTIHIDNQDVWLGYKWKEHFLLLPKIRNELDYRELGVIINVLMNRWYNIEWHGKQKQSVKKYFHIHVFR